jgi:hypothetical protein
MTDIQTLQKYEDWKSAKKKRKLWFNIISWVSGLSLAYITICFMSKCGLGNVWKTLKYGFATKIETKEERNNLPSDYLTWYKERKMEETWTHKKFGHESSPYFTYEEIAKRKAEKEGKDLLGELGGQFAAWLASWGVDESKKKEVDWIAYANDVYSNSAMIIFWGFILFLIIYSLIIRYIVLPLSWKEPKLTE